MLNMLAICPFCKAETWFEADLQNPSHMQFPMERCRKCGAQIRDLMTGFDFEPVRYTNIVRFNEPMVAHRKLQLRRVMVDA